MTSQGTLPLLTKLWPAIRVGASSPSVQDPPIGTPPLKLLQHAELTLCWQKSLRPFHLCRGLDFEAVC